jgi:hypothetical protein
MTTTDQISHSMFLEQAGVGRSRLMKVIPSTGVSATRAMRFAPQYTSSFWNSMDPLDQVLMRADRKSILLWRLHLE